MATINRDAIETFMNVTGVTESIATQRLQEHGGNLYEAVNAHFSEGHTNIVQEASITGTSPPNDLMDIDEPSITGPRNPTSLSSTTRDINPFSILDVPLRNIPFASQPSEVREIPLQVKDGGDNLGASSGHGPRIDDVTETIDSRGPRPRGNVIAGVENEDYISGNVGGGENNSRPSASQFEDMSDNVDDIEEEMIRAAIEESKRDAQLLNNQTLEEEQLPRETSLQVGASRLVTNNPDEVAERGNIIDKQDIGAFDKSESTQPKKEEGSSSAQYELDESDETRFARNRSSSLERTQREIGELETNPNPNSPPSVASRIHPNGNAFPSEWGGISSEEHDEAVMLEAAMFGGIPERGYHVPYAPHQMIHPGFDTSSRMPRPPSPGLVAQRAIREQQDDEYVAALQADREKELKAIEDAKVATEAALEERRREEGESQRKLDEEQELERQLAAKEASLPEEPSSDNKNIVTLLIRMPDGSRHGRRFLKSEKLQSLFDFIDVGKVVKPGSYRLVRPYPRQAFSIEDSGLSLHELGLTSKQEALFLELI